LHIGFHGFPFDKAITTQRGFLTLGKGGGACFDISQASRMLRESFVLPPTEALLTFIKRQLRQREYAEDRIIQRTSAMTHRVGKVERWFRIAAGIALLSLLFVLEGNTRWWGLLGLFPLLTGLFSFCPLYWAIGVD
jgi:hypothetical protein